MNVFNRRQLMAASATVAAASLAANAADAREVRAADDGPAFRYCFNTSTIRGQKLSVPQQIRVAAEAGYDGIEPWMGDLHEYVNKGGKPAELRKLIEDSGLVIASAIGFAPWIVDDEVRRTEALDESRRDMELLQAIGGLRIAAPPSGATDQTDLNLMHAAVRYRALIELGEQFGIVPQLELWGFSKSLSRLGELAYIAAEAGHPQACVLPDVYHIYKGGSDLEGLRLINARVIHVFHMNDYPADPPRETINDSDRVFPGLGIAPLDKIVRILHEGGFRGMLSLELFNRDYWSRDPLDVARYGLAAMREVVAKGTE